MRFFSEIPTGFMPASIIGVSVLVAVVPSVTMANEVTGIGITLYQEDNGNIVITDVIDGGSAIEAGILPGDIIVSIDSEIVEGIDTQAVSELIKGPVNSSVDLVVVRNGETLDFKLTRVAFTPPMTGLFNSSGDYFNELTFYPTRYVGDCPGFIAAQPFNNARLSGLPGPAPDRRVVITNQRTGGYSNRDYSGNGEVSESFEINIGERHENRYLTVLPGENDLTYSVLEGGEEIGGGRFSLSVVEEIRESSRSYTRKEKEAFCFGEAELSAEERSDLDTCEGGLITIQEVGYCPDGSAHIISEETIR